MTTCPITGLPAKYRHPRSNIPYATAHAYKVLDALMHDQYLYSAEMGAWMGAEAGEHAEGVEEVEGWGEAVHGGWVGGRRLGEVEDVQVQGEVEGDEGVVRDTGEVDGMGQEDGEEEGVEEKPDVVSAKGKSGKGKRKRDSVVVDSPVPSKSKSKKGRKSVR